jgi:hypothetical protein
MKRFLARVMSTAGVVAVSLVLLGGCDQQDKAEERRRQDKETARVMAANERAAQLADEAANAESAAAQATTAIGANHGSCNHSPDTEPEAFDASPECN